MALTQRQGFAALAGWHDEARSGRVILIALALFVAAWTLFHGIVFAPYGLHPDVSEMYAWSRFPLAGYYKHPPLGALMCAAWFAVFPAADWAFNLLAMGNAALGLYFTDCIARRSVAGDKRLMVLLLLLLTPFYSFFGQKFNANAVLLSTWPLATYCFLRAYDTRALGWSIAAGLACALAMLGKYYSIFLIGGIVIAALTHPGRMRYLKSLSPWISCATGALLLAPHVRWLFANHFEPFVYAYTVHGEVTLGTLLLHAVGYLAGAIGYVALPAIVYLIAVRPNRALLRETAWPADPDRRMPIVLLGGFILLPPLSSPLLGIDLTSLWTMSAWFLLPVILLAPPQAQLSRRAVARTAAGLLAFTVLAIVVAAPVLAALNFQRPESDDRGYDRPLAALVTKAWHERIGRPLALVLGEARLTAALTFYIPEHPASVPDFVWTAAPWVTPAQAATSGWAAACRADDAACIGMIAAASAQNSRAVRSQVEIVPRFLGYDGKPARFVIAVVPPRAVADLTQPAFALNLEPATAFTIAK